MLKRATAAGQLQALLPSQATAFLPLPPAPKCWYLFPPMPHAACYLLHATYMLRDYEALDASGFHSAILHILHGGRYPGGTCILGISPPGVPFIFNLLFTDRVDYIIQGPLQAKTSSSLGACFLYGLPYYVAGVSRYGTCLHVDRADISTPADR